MTDTTCQNYNGTRILNADFVGVSYLQIGIIMLMAKYLNTYITVLGVIRIFTRNLAKNILLFSMRKFWFWLGLRGTVCMLHAYLNKFIVKVKRDILTFFAHPCFAQPDRR